MNWSKAKTILIVVFLFTDIFLATTIYKSNRKASYIPADIIDSTISILKDNNITINRELISSEIEMLSTIQGDNVVTSYEEFAEKILGNGFILLDETTFKSDSGKLYFNGDSFRFESTGKLSGNNSLSPMECEKKIKSTLQGYGFVFTNVSTKVSEKPENGYTIIFQDYYNSSPIYASNVIVMADDSGNITQLSGTWYNIKDDFQTDDNELKSVTSILIDFISEYGINAPCEIVGLDLGFNVFESEIYHKSASLIPVQKITLKGGKEYYIDSRNSN